MGMTDQDLARAQDRRRLEVLAPLLHDHLPAAPARVVEIGCGPQGGFVPGLRAAGYDATGVDPDAPEGAAYHPTAFEAHHVPSPVDAVVASVSLHHVADLDQVLDKIATSLVPGGAVVVFEWAHERFDEPTARWCFDRLGPTEHGQGWLQHHREAWEAADQSWESYRRGWAEDERLFSGDDIVRALSGRFETRALSPTTYFHPYLDHVTEADERAAIDAGRIRATGIWYAGRREMRHRSE